MILTVTANPCIDRAMFVHELRPFDTNRVTRTEVDAGGKGINLSRVAKEMGAPTLATGVLGGQAGQFIRSILDGRDVPHDFMEIVGETRTNSSVEEAMGNPPTTFNEQGPAITEAELAELHDHCLGLADRLNPAWVCLCGSVPPGVPPEFYGELGGAIRGRGIRLLVDADGPLLAAGLSAKPDMLKPNLEEAERFLGHSIVGVNGAVAATRELAELASDGAYVLVSLGAQGAVLRVGSEVWVGKSPEITAVSTIGSGDSLLGALLSGLVSGLSVSMALRWGLAAGAATALTNGAQIANRAAIEELYPRAVVAEIPSAI